MSGLSYGTLLVLEEVGKTKAGTLQWKCQCECGTIVVRTGTSLRRSKHSNCGNGICGILRGKDSPHFRGVGEISAGWFLNKIIRSANGEKQGNRVRLPKELTIDMHYLWDLFLKQDRKCALSGLELTLPLNETSRAYSQSTASVDRIDSSKGYIPGNIQWVHKRINLMKNKLDNNYFIELCINVANTYSNGTIRLH